MESAQPKVAVYQFAYVVFGVTSIPFLLNATAQACYKLREGGSRVREPDASLIVCLEERDTSTEQKVLGTNWSYIDDEFFKFQAQVKSTHGLSATKQNVLHIKAGFYDPMGLISSFIVQLKTLLQYICKANYPWNAGLDSRLKAR